MNNELISKKDLLDLTGISYGQLYRWKRKDLIPEDWFIRKSTFTGQETFFPKEKILERIEKIQSLKEGLSLDELADMFSPTVSNISLSKGDIVERNIISNNTFEFFFDKISEPFSFDQVLYLYTVEKMLHSGDINLEEGNMMLQIMQNNPEIVQNNSNLIFIRKLGISSCFLTSNIESLVFETGTRVIAQISLALNREELKAKLI